MQHYGRAGRLGIVSLLVAAATMTVGAGGAGYAIAEESGMQRHVTVSAEGVVSAKPDMARISSGVVSEADTASEALKQNSAAMTRLIDGLKAANVAGEDIKTSSFNVQPRYVHSRDGNQAPRIEGYSVSNNVGVIVQDLSRLGSLLDTLVRLGANQIGGLSFDVSRVAEIKNEARKAAIVNARKRAEIYATASGAKLGQVLTISEDVAHIAPRGPMLARAAMSESVPIEEGTQDVMVRVTVSWALQ